MSQNVPPRSRTSLVLSSFTWYVDIHHALIVYSYLIIQGILINGMLKSEQT